jgi:hypothetical protein
VGISALAALFLSGCAAPSLHQARLDFYSGRFDRAESALADARIPEKDRILWLMERGMIRQMRGAYAESSRDLIRAADLLEELRAYSLTRDTATVLIDDTVRDFRGAPFEQTMLHAFTAMNHLAMGHWDDGAVEARRIIKSVSPEVKGSYPDDAVSRYVAGFCLEMIGDGSNAALQYRMANEALRGVWIDDATGRLQPRAAATNAAPVRTQPPSPFGPASGELVCFILAGRIGPHAPAASRFSDPPTYAEIFCDGRRLGRSYTLSDTVDLAFTTEQVEATRKAVKTAARLTIKETLADAIERDDKLLGGLVRLVLLGMLERPDVRRWETLPRWLGVARVPCPPDLSRFTVVFRNDRGGILRKVDVVQPLSRQGRVFVSFCRDLPPASP